MDPVRLRTTTGELAHEVATGGVVLPAILELLDQAAGADALSTMPVSREGHAEAIPLVRGGPPLSVRELELWPRLADTHPYLSRLWDGPLTASRVTDVVSLSDLERLEVYQRLLRPRDARYQAALVLERTDESILVVSLWRACRNFTDEELGTLELIRRPIAAAMAYHAALAALHGPGAAIDHGLTPRQREVAALVALGLTNDQIGRRLLISPRTVRKHLEGAFGLTGSTSRAGLAAWWSARSATLAS